MATKNPLYRIIFIQNDKSYEIYAKFISEDHLMGFIEIEELVFPRSEKGVVIDPNEDRLRQEFKGVKRSYIPMHAITRIDEVVEHGVARVVDLNENSSNNISHFPASQHSKKDKV